MSRIETRHRVQSIDILRGLVMVIMALDHVRDFFHESAITGDPTDLAITTPALFFTRWITHFCAPVFVFLSGASAYLVGRRKTKKELSNFLIKRGLWLVFAEIVIVTLGLSFNPSYNIFFLQVIWAIGWSMVILGLLVHLPFRVVVLVGLLIFFGHNGFDYVTIPERGVASVLLKLFITQPANFFPISADHTIAVLYKILPWTSVIILGYGFGYFLKSDIEPAKRRSAMFITGFILIGLFVVLRFLNTYGDPQHWSPQKSAFYTFLSFINTTKYPPSLLYLCMTLGPAIILLGLIDNVANEVTSFFAIFGRVPFFYYILHFYLIHILCVVAFYLSGFNSSQIVDQNSPFWFRPAAFGFSLLTVYAIWLLVILIMYPLCRRYSTYKLTHTQWWLSYL